MHDPNVDPVTRTTLRRKSIFAYTLVSTLIVCLLLAALGYFLVTPPPNTRYPKTIEVEFGMSVRSVATLAKESNLVRSELLLYALLNAFNDPTNIHAGRYIFNEPQNSIQVARKIANNEVDELLVTLTIPEGITVKKIAEIAAAVLPNFDSEAFISLATLNEGFLFPETYFVPETFTAQDLFELQTVTFTERVALIENQASSTPFEKAKEIIILASIIEREANSEESMKMVSGILQNRLRLDMPLQADATIEYALTTPLNELAPGELAKQLKELDSPYNTYLYKGLPPTPIGNPGLMAIEAAFNPTPSEYLFYVTDEAGNFYYAETLTEHNNNVAKYLR